MREEGRGSLWRSYHLGTGAKVSSFQNDTSGLYGFLAGGSGRTDRRSDRTEGCIDKSVDLPCAISRHTFLPATLAREELFTI